MEAAINCLPPGMFSEHDAHLCDVAHAIYHAILIALEKT
jgi:hypothetical protein